MYCSPYRLQLTCRDTPYDTIKRAQFKSSRTISGSLKFSFIFVLAQVAQSNFPGGPNMWVSTQLIIWNRIQVAQLQYRVSPLNFPSPSRYTFLTFRGLIRDGLYPTSGARILVLSITGTINFARTMDISNYDNNETALRVISGNLEFSFIFVICSFRLFHEAGAQLNFPGGLNTCGYQLNLSPGIVSR